MAVLEILHYPDPRLRSTSSAIDTVNNDIRTLIDDMLETMYAAPGIGLAAIQVNVAKRLVVIDVSNDRSSPVILLNPEILALEGSRVESEEGCLSIPGIYENVKRPARALVRALNKDGKEFDMEAEGLLSTCIQHEIDHLDGKLFVDYLSRLKRHRIRKKAEKQSRSMS